MLCSYRFYAIVSAIAYSLSPAFLAGDPGREAALLNRVVRRMIAMTSRMPPHLRWSVVALTYALDLYAWLIRFRCFQRLSRIERVSVLDRLRASKINALRRIVKFHATLFAMQLYSCAEVIDQLPNGRWT